MKKIILITLLVTAFCSITLAQQNLKKYYANVFKGEQCIIDKKYAKGAKYYETAMKNKEWGFTGDLQNAMYCEIMWGTPSIKNCNNYALQYAKQGAGGEALCEDLPAFIDTLENFPAPEILFNCLKNENIALAAQAEKEKIKSILESLHDRDQWIRQDGTQQAYADSFLLGFELRNMYELKNLMQTVNIFDERIVYYNSISTLFNHWFLFMPWEQDHFIPIALKAVHEGTLDARNFIDLTDILSWRKNFETPISPYGSKFYTIYKQMTEGEQYTLMSGKHLVFSNFDEKDPKNKTWIKKTNKLRKAIYLDDLITSGQRNFKLWELWLSDIEHVANMSARGAYLMPSYDIYQLLEEKLKENPKLNYYITGEHDFNTK